MEHGAQRSAPVPELGGEGLLCNEDHWTRPLVGSQPGGSHTCHSCEPRKFTSCSGGLDQSFRQGCKPQSWAGLPYQPVSVHTPDLGTASPTHLCAFCSSGHCDGDHAAHQAQAPDQTLI